MSKHIGADADEIPTTSLGKYLSGDDYRKDLIEQGKLRKYVDPSVVPKRERVFRIADELMKKFNEWEKFAEKNPNSAYAMKLDQLHNEFNTDNITDLAMILANMELQKMRKKKLKDILYRDKKGEEGGIKLSSMAKEGLNENIWTTGNKTEDQLKEEQNKYNEKLKKSMVSGLFA